MTYDLTLRTLSHREALDFACLPDGPLCATTFFYKHCAPASALGR